MYYFGKKSRNKIRTLHPDLRMILGKAIEVYDISVLEGIRSEERQQALFHEDPPKTTLDGIERKSKHQGRKCKQSEAGTDEDGNVLRDKDGSIICSYAVDICPYKRGQNPFENSEKNWRRYYFMMGIIKSIAHDLKKEGLIAHDIRFGLDWDSDFVYSDQNFDDLPHMELV